MRTGLLILTTLFCCTNVFSQSKETLLRKGNSLYSSGNYKDAEVSYRKALTKDSNNAKGKFNLGDAIYKQKNFEELSKTFQSLLENNLDKSTKAKIYHNIGNSLLQSKKYEQSVEAYKNALRNNPNDQDTKYNLSYAMKMLQQQKQQQQQNKQDQKKDDKKDQKQDQKKDQKKDDNKDKQQQQKKDQISKADAQRMLDALNNKDKNLQDKLKAEKVVPAKVKVEKDW